MSLIGTLLPSAEAASCPQLAEGDRGPLNARRTKSLQSIRRQLRFVQLDQVLHLAALAIDVLVEVLRRARERDDDERMSRAPTR
jgi:hypothetical protein